MLNMYQLYQNADDIDYGRYSDQYNRWADEQGAAQSAYDNAGNRDYNTWTANKQYAYNYAMSILQTGNVPSDDMLQQAGLSRPDAELLASYYANLGKGGGGGGSKTPTYNTKKFGDATPEMYDTKNAGDASAFMGTLTPISHNNTVAQKNGTVTQYVDKWLTNAVNSISSALDSKQITTGQAKTALSMVEEEARIALNDNQYNQKYGTNVNNSKNPQANPILDYMGTNGQAVSSDQFEEHMKWSTNAKPAGR